MEQIKNKEITEKHKKFLIRKLKRVNHMRAYDAALNDLYKEYPDLVRWYLRGLDSVFLYLIRKYQNKDEMAAAYFPYIVKKYNILQGTTDGIFLEVLVDMAGNKSIYCRENALEALYSVGNAKSVVAALMVLDKSYNYHHSKLLTDGLLTFAGDPKELGELLWKVYPKFSVHMKVAVLDYFRFSRRDHSERMLRLLEDEKEDDEVHYSCIRYFASMYYEPAFPVLCDIAEGPTGSWQYHAIAATALARYPSERSVNILKKLLMSRNWYVCFNAAESLERLGIEYDELVEIFEGPDRLASDILRYRLDHLKLMEKKKGAVK